MPTLEVRCLACCEADAPQIRQDEISARTHEEEARSQEGRVYFISGTDVADPIMIAFPEMKVGDTLTVNGIKGFVVGAITRRYLSGRTAAAMKPWEAEGISRATWYRWKKEQKK